MIKTTDASLNHAEDSVEVYFLMGNMQQVHFTCIH